MSGNPDGKTENSSRRSVLKMSGAALAGMVGVSSPAAAKPSETDIFEQSLELREKAGWSVSRWHDYLDKRGLNFTTVSETITRSVPSDDGGDVGTQKLDRVDSEFTYTYTDMSGYDTVQMDWNHKAGDVDDYGESPPDGAGISYDSDHYDRTYDTSDWVYYSENAQDPNDYDSKDPNHGAACIFKDGLVPQDNDGYFGIRVEPNTSLGQYDRELEFDYAHTWPNGELTGVSIGTGGIAFTFSSKTDRWDYETSYREGDIDDTETDDPGTA